MFREGNHGQPRRTDHCDRRGAGRTGAPAGAPSTPAGLSRRARAILLMAQGLSGVEIAERIGYTVVQVSRIRRRYAEGGVAGLQERAESGRPATITARKRAQIVALTLKPPGGGVTHWTTRDLARTTGVSHSTVHRLWQAHTLKPHQAPTFKFTADPAAEAKIHDVVGLYLNPPTHVVVLSVDEKTQIQALSRTQPLRPLRPGRPAPDARLSPPRPDELVCGARDRQRTGSALAHDPAHWRGLLGLPATAGAYVSAAGAACDSR